MSKQISYAEFGHNFIQQVVTARRLGDTIQSALDTTIAGSFSKLPANLMVISYVFKLRDLNVEPVLSELPHLSFVLYALGDIRLDMMFFGVEFKFTLAVDIQVHIDVETYEPVVLKLIPQAVTSRNIRIDLVGENLPSEILDNLMVVKPIVRDQIVREVNQRIADPALQQLATIDVLAMVDKFGIGEA